MGLIKGAIKTVGVIGLPTLGSYILEHYVIGSRSFIREMVNHALTAGMVYACAAKIPILKYGDGGLEGILKGIATTGAKLGGVYMCTYDLVYGTHNIPSGIAYVWNGLSTGVSKVGWLVDTLTKYTPLPDTSLEKSIYGGMSLNGLSKHVSAETVAVYTAGFFSVMGIIPTLKYLGSKITSIFSGKKGR